jgi:hypothetical protein
MTLITRTTNCNAGSFVSLHVMEVDPQRVARCYVTEHIDSFYMDITGKGATEIEARRDLAKRIRAEVRKLEDNHDKRPSQERRLALLKSFVG